jgi:hypothetical protein
MNRRLRGSLRLVRHELGLALTVLQHEDLSAEEIQDRVRRGTLSYQQWTVNQAVLAELLPRHQWVDLSSAYLGLRFLIDDVEEESDDELMALAAMTREKMEEVGDVVWSKDQAPRRALLNLLRRRHPDRDEAS